MNFQAYLADTYRIIKEEPVILILGGVVVQLLTILSLGILAGPFLGGYFLLIIYFLRDNKKPSFNDIFSGLQQFGNLFPFVLVILLIFIGFMLLVLMVDRKLPLIEAMRLSKDKVNETGFLMHFVFLLLISVIPMMLLNFLSAMMPFLLVLKILLPPFQAGCLASLYIDKFGLAETKDLHEEEEVETAPVEVPAPQIAGATEQTAAVEEDTPAANETPDDLSSNTERQNHSHENDDGQEKN